MKLSRRDRRARSAVRGVEILENRCLLTAAMVAQIPTQSLAAGQTAAPIVLSNYLNDSSITGGTVVEIQTSQGNIPLQLDDAQTPISVANFLHYVSSGEYANTIIHRSVAGFVIQGGGFYTNGTAVTAFPAIASEAGISNTIGTIAVALGPSGPGSGSSNWFINTANNDGTGPEGTNLNDGSEGGPYTVFGSVIDGGMTVVNKIAALPTVVDTFNGEFPDPSQNPFSTLPVMNYSGSSTTATVDPSNMVTTNTVVLTASQAAGTYAAVTRHPALVTASVVNGQLTLTPNSAGAAGSATVTATLTDIGGETATSTFTVNVQGMPAVSIANATASVGTASQVAFPITLSIANTSATTFDYTLSPGTAPAGDFQATGASVTIPAGATQASIPVNILGDQAHAGETFFVTLSNISGNAIFFDGMSTQTATGTITEPTTIALATATPVVVDGGSDLLTATVNPAVAGAAVATGTVNFIVAGASIGTAALSGNVATLNATFSTPGSETISAIYEGNSNYGASTSNAVTVDIAAPPALTPVITKSAFPPAIVAGAPVHGAGATLKITNATQGPEDGTATINVYASLDGVIDDSSTLIASIPHGVHLKPGKSVSVHVSVKNFPTSLVDGTYTVLVQTTDPSGAMTDATTGPTIQVAAAVVSLSAPAAAIKPPVIKLGKSGTFTVTLANAGNIATSGSASINLGLSSDGQTEAITLVDTSKVIKIKVGGTVTLHLHFVAPANAMAGMYMPFVSVTDDGSTATAFGTTPITLGA